jgi:hypothetical protein
MDIEIREQVWFDAKTKKAVKQHNDGAEKLKSNYLEIKNKEQCLVNSANGIECLQQIQEIKALKFDSIKSEMALLEQLQTDVFLLINQSFDRSIQKATNDLKKATEEKLQKLAELKINRTGAFSEAESKASEMIRGLKNYRNMVWNPFRYAVEGRQAALPEILAETVKKL